MSIANGDKYKCPQLDGFVQHDFAMTFEEIGAELGISHKGAWMLYASAMVKLRSRREAFRHLLDLHHELESHRQGNEEGL